MQKTLDMEADILTRQPITNEAQNITFDQNSDDDEDGYEYYPIG